MSLVLRSNVFVDARSMLEWRGSQAMKAKSDPTLSFDPDAWELSVVAHQPRTWLPSSSRTVNAVNPQLWQTRAARGFSWHRAGRAVKRETRQ